ncbi:unnamed protein product, partial [Chrysoparadoxa australica]
FLGRQDPFVEVRWQDQTLRTSIKRNAGKKAKWDDELKFIVAAPSDLSVPLMVEVINDNQGDKAASSDVVIGFGEVPLEDLLHSGTSQKTLDL